MATFCVMFEQQQQPTTKRINKNIHSTLLMYYVYVSCIYANRCVNYMYSLPNADPRLLLRIQQQLHFPRKHLFIMKKKNEEEEEELDEEKQQQQKKQNGNNIKRAIICAHSTHKQTHSATQRVSTFSKSLEFIQQNRRVSWVRASNTVANTNWKVAVYVRCMRFRWMWENVA